MVLAERATFFPSSLVAGVSTERGEVAALFSLDAHTMTRHISGVNEHFVVRVKYSVIMRELTAALYRYIHREIVPSNGTKIWRMKTREKWMKGKSSYFCWRSSTQNDYCPNFPSLTDTFCQMES